MLLELIARYYKFLWFALIVIALVKLILAYSFDESLQGINGLLYALFNWYGEEEQELEDEPKRRKLMRYHNVITITQYGMLLIILIVTLLSKILPH